MIKRIAAVVLLIAALLHAAAFAEADWALTEAQSLAQHIHRLASDEAYRTTLYTEEVKIKAAELALADFSEPAAVWRVGIPDVQPLYEMLSAFASTDDSLGNVLNMSDIGFKEFARRVPTYVLSAAVGQAASGDGDSMIWSLLNTTLMTSKGYVEPEAFEPCALLVDYPGSFGVAVTFAEIGDGVVCATAQPVPSGMMANAAVQEAIDMLSDAGCALDIRRIIAD